MFNGTNIHIYVTDATHDNTYIIVILGERFIYLHAKVCFCEIIVVYNGYMCAGGVFRAISVCSRLISSMDKVWHEGGKIFTQFGSDNLCSICYTCYIYVFICINNLKQNDNE